MNIGGPAIHAALLATRLDPQRFSTCLVVGQPDPTEGDLSDLVPQDQVRLIRLRSLRRPIRPWADLVTWWRLLRILWRERPALIHTHMAKAGALGRLAGVVYNRLGPGRLPGARAVLVHTFHGHVLEGYFSTWASRLFLLIERWLARRTDCLIAVSRSVQRQLRAQGIGRPDQWRVIPLGLDIAALATLPLPNGSPYIRVGLVGRLVPIKNPGLFLEALHRVARRLPADVVRGVIVGDGPLRASMQQQARALGVSERIQFTGWQRDLRAVYDGLEVTCVTSWNEGTPVALIEAMAAARAVVATRVGGVQDVLGQGVGPAGRTAPGGFTITERGVLVRAGDAEGLAAALERVATDATLRRDLGQAARAYVLERFTPDRLARDITALYDGLEASRAG